MIMKRGLITFFVISTIFTGCASHSETIETTDNIVVEETANVETEVSIPNIKITEPATVPETEDIKGG